MNRLFDIAGGVLIGFLISFFVISSYKNDYIAVKDSDSKPWFEIPKSVADKLSAQYVSIDTDGYTGSGCQIKPGFYLTSLHVIANAILDESLISVNDQKAQVVWKSKTDEDYVILTTWAEFDKRKLDFPPFNNFADNINIILVGSPGDQQKLVQPGKILRSAQDDNKKIKEYAKVISAQYVDYGLSGGCVYSEDGETLLGVLTSKYQSPGSTIGEVTIVNRPIE